MAEGMEEMEKQAKRLDLALESNKDKMSHLVTILDNLGEGMDKTLTPRLEELLENRVKEGNVLTTMTKQERLYFDDSRKNLEKWAKDGTNRQKALANVTLRRYDYEKRAEERKKEKMIASEQGMLTMMTVRWKEATDKIEEGMHKYLGITSKAGSNTVKVAAGITLVGVAVMALMAGAQKFTRRIEEVNIASMRVGGFLERGWVTQSAFALSFGQEITDAASFGMTFNQVMDSFNTAVDEGAIALTAARMGFSDYSKITMSDQDKIMSKVIQSSAHLQKMGQAIFGTTEAMPQIIKTAKFFRLNLEDESTAMLSQIYQLGTESGASTMSLMNVLNAAGERAFMTGQDIMHTVNAMDAIGEAFGDVTDNAAETEALFDALGQAVSGFDTMKYMAVMQTNAGNIGAQYGEALQKGPLQQMGSYINMLATQIGGPNVAEKMALMMPEFRSMGQGGVQLLKAITSRGFQESIAGVTSEEGLKKALMDTGEVDSERIAAIGAAEMAGKDIQEKLLDVVVKFQAVMLDGMIAIIKKIPGSNKIADAFERKNKALQIENANKPGFTGGFRVK